MSLAAQRRQSLWRPRQPGNANPESNSYVLLLIDGGGVLCRPNIEQHCSFIARTKANKYWLGRRRCGGRNRCDIGCFSLSFVSRHRHLRSRWPCIQVLTCDCRDCDWLNFPYLFSVLGITDAEFYARYSPPLHNHLTRTRATASNHKFTILACPPTITLVARYLRSDITNLHTIRAEKAQKR